MKYFLSLIAAGMALGCCAQLARPDSLAGFNVGAVIAEAHQHRFTAEDLKSYVKQRESEFLQKKFNLSVPFGASQTVLRLGPGQSISNMPCLDEDFEASPLGPLASPGWSASTGNNGFPTPMLCYTNVPVFSLSNSAASVSATPITDANCNNVSTSPFGGNNVVKLKGGFGPPINSRIVQTFPVTGSNFIYEYAYKGFSDGAYHACCEAPNFIFNFYDCSGNLISASSKTIIPNVFASICGFTLTTWTVTPGSLAYTPNWVLTAENLAPYIGSCVTVEVIASGCATNVHTGYCYYDAKCSNSGMTVNGDLVTGSSYTSCAPTATLSGLSGFASYAWLGPAGSGVSGATASLVTTSTPGNYTLTASSGVVSMTHTLNLLLNTLGSVSIAGNNTVCAGSSVSLQLQGNGISSFTWSSNSNSNNLSFTVTPATTTVYAVSATNSLGCMSSDSKTVTVFATPTLAITGPTAVCMGQSVALNVLASPGISYSWSTGSSAPSITVSPLVSTVYFVTVFSAAGCASYTSIAVQSLTVPVAQLVVSTSSVCAGMPVMLSVFPTAGNSVLWSTGSTSVSLYETPNLTTPYSVTLTNASGCSNSIAMTVMVQPVPQIQLAASSSVVCSGQPVNLSLAGNNVVYSMWSTGVNALSITVTPTAGAVYSVTVANPAGCITRDSIAVNVMPSPGVQLAVSAQTICQGDQLNVSAITNSAVTSFLWNNGQTTSAIVVSPTLTALYTVTVTAANGCLASASQSVQVSVCTGLQSLRNMPDPGIRVFPNPGSESFTIKGTKSEQGSIINELGQVLKEFNLSAQNNFSQSFSGFAPGIYFVRTAEYSIKLIVK